MTTEQKLFDAFEDSMSECFEDFNDQFEHEYEQTSVPYGDTYKRLPEVITESSRIRCCESFKQDFDINKFFDDYLKNNDKFKDAILEYLKRNY